MSNNGGHTPVFVVLGATGLVGSEVARRLSTSGAKVIIVARDTLKLERLCEELQAPAISLDAARLDQVEAALEQVRRSFGRIDGVVCCVGSAPERKPITNMSGKDWMEQIDQNLTPAFATVRAAAQVMREAGGAVVLVSAWTALTGIADMEAYSAAKAGILGLTRSAAAALAPHGIRVNCVAPGPLATPSESFEFEPDLAEPGVEPKSYHEALAVPQVGSADDVASAIVWLLKPEQRWITGQVLCVDGGECCCRR